MGENSKVQRERKTTWFIWSYTEWVKIQILTLVYSSVHITSVSWSWLDIRMIQRFLVGLESGPGDHIFVTNLDICAARTGQWPHDYSVCPWSGTDHGTYHFFTLTEVISIRTYYLQNYWYKILWGWGPHVGLVPLLKETPESLKSLAACTGTKERPCKGTLKNVHQ